MPAPRLKSEKRDANEHLPRDPYEVLGVSSNCSDQEIKSAYRKKALKYHPDKNANDPAAAEMFKEVIFAYDILSDPDKRQQYDEAGFEAVGSESKELELDLSTLGAVDTIFAALFCKLGVQIKTTVSANVLEEARNGTVLTLPLPLGQVVSRKVEKHCAHFYSVTLTEDESRSGLVFRAQSPAKSKFKLLYFEREEDGGLNLALQEDSRKTGKISSAGMYFLGFPVYRFDQTTASVGLARNPDAGFFKKLDGFHPCEITELKAGSHVFAVYGDNFFRSVNYTLEVLTAAPFAKEKEILRSIETEVISRTAELSKFESEYEQVYARFTEMTDRCTQEMEMIDELMNQRYQVQAMYTIHRPLKQNPSKNKNLFVEAREDDDARAGKKKRWFNSLKFKS